MTISVLTPSVGATGGLEEDLPCRTNPAELFFAESPSDVEAAWQRALAA